MNLGRPIRILENVPAQLPLENEPAPQPSEPEPAPEEAEAS